jgi:phenylacetate-coenzyme A ligase PaaK-like adenylate-forming protein
LDNRFLHTDKIFNISTDEMFEELAIELFKFQYKNNKIYQKYCNLLKINPKKINKVEKIPFLPISFFKSHKVYCGNKKSEIKFFSSGTTGMTPSIHFVKNVNIYKQSFIKGFSQFYGDIQDYIVIGLLPSYLEREGSSLIYMVEDLIKKSKHEKSGFFLNEFDEIEAIVNEYQSTKKILIIGVSYALLDFSEKNKPDLSNCIVMETGGMKGKRKEMPKQELHQILKKRFNVNQIHSEYGMTELLSQAYALKNGKFKTPPWMKVITRETNDPFSFTSQKTGGLNIIDLANIYSCAFIATQDLGRVHNNYFEVLGRFDNSDIRGCNLLVQ